MYWSRTGSILDILIWSLELAGAWLGGWLLVRALFVLKPRERLVTGLSAGLLLFIVLTNLLVHFISLPLACAGAAVLILVAGLAAAWRGPRHPWRADLRAWPQLVVLAGLTLLFVMIGRGLALFDDYLHIPLVSVMAAGDIPPHFYLDPTQPMAYHYGLQVLAAGMVRVGGLFPWSAWDLCKALAIALTLLLGWLWVRRLTHSELAANLGTFLVTFGGGARWLLLFLPPALVLWMSSGVHLAPTGLSTGPDLLTALSRPWAIEGGGPFPFPFAFHNGIFVPVMFVLGSTGAMPFFTILLLLLLIGRRRFSFPAALVVGLILASLALSAEHLFVFLLGGILLAGLVSLLLSRRQRRPVDGRLILGWGAALLTGGILSVVQGAYLTEAVRNLLLRFQGTPATAGPYNNFGFVLRWPPALISGHLGELSFVDPKQVVVLLAELGPVLLLAPLASLYAWKRLKRQDWLFAGLGVAALFNFLLPTFFDFAVEHSITRMAATAEWLWLLLAFPFLWQAFIRGSRKTRFWLDLGYGITAFGGIVIFAVQLTAILAPQLTSFVNSYDAQMSRELWNRLPEGAQVFDPSASRSVSLFGRASGGFVDVYTPKPEWEALVNNPDPVAIAQAGYSFMYVDRNWWKGLKPAQQKAIEQPCVQMAAKLTPDDEDFRWLLDVRSCRSTSP
ncbi:MAG TPA: hypothetical protein VF823_00940 [Anaerolineales bacterium]